jgi:hypothetical protein
MTAAEVYPPRPIKRARSTKADVEARREALYEIVAAQQPMTVRQVFYQATVQGIVEKTEGGYAKVKDDLKVLRKSGELPYEWLADSTRWQRKPRTFNSVEDALRFTAQTYRKALWSDSDAYVEIWCEKDALAGIISEITVQYDVPLMIARGYASLSFLHSAAEAIEAACDDNNKKAHIYHFGDYDPSGQDAARDIEAKLREMAPNAEINFERVAVTPEQIRRWGLPTRPNKSSDSRTASFAGAASVELDAIPPDRLRHLVEAVINRHVDDDELETLRVAEKSEREQMQVFAALARKPAKGAIFVAPNGVARKWLPAPDALFSNLG